MQLTDIPGFDAAVMEFVQNHMHNAVTDAVFPVITLLGEAGAVWIITALILLCFKKTRVTGVLVLITMLITFVTGELCLKNLICRPRPCQAFPDIPLLIARPDSWSFPSGH
ncbi:MAG: phosphatase PAP2 family protein, partial [Clostridia bacterium]|nr:phosphatase PAP2 family protein [Clostridia bacterium]